MRRDRQSGGRFCSGSVLFVFFSLLLTFLFVLFFKSDTIRDNEQTQKTILLQPNHIVEDVLVAFNRARHGDFSGADATESLPKDEQLSRKSTCREFYTVFSTDCSAFQDWQSIVVFHSALAVGQQGTVVRIASGCPLEKQHKLTELYSTLFPDSFLLGAAIPDGNEDVDPLRVRVHFTPEFSKDEKTKRDYKFYNKPRGFRHWLQHSTSPDNANPMGPDAVIALIDPDFVFLRPLSARVQGLNSSIYSSSYKPADLDFQYVTKGRAVAQMYGLGAPWTNDNHKHFKRGAICGEGSPCLLPTPRFGERHYAVGPPYLLHRDDWARLADTWTAFVPKVYEGYPHLLAEMYAYSMAAAHERLPHLQAEHLMVSCTGCYGEGWQWVDALDNVCVPPQPSQDADSPVKAYQYRFYPTKEMPTFVHYCQQSRVEVEGKEMSFYKRQMPHGLFNFSRGEAGCSSKLLAEPPLTAGRPITVPKGATKKERNAALYARRDAFMLCAIHRAVNAALTYCRPRLCPSR